LKNDLIYFVFILTTKKKALRSNLDNPLFDGGLLDSLDTTTNNNNRNFYNNNKNFNTSNNNNNNNNKNPYQLFNSSSNNNFQQPQQSKPLYEQQLQQPQPYQPPLPLAPPPPPPPPSHQLTQYQPVQALQTFTSAQPFQFPQGGIFLIPSPTANALVNSQSQFQFQPNQQQLNQQPQPSNALQVIPQQNPSTMFYQEPIQPMFYNTAYPLNLAGGGGGGGGVSSNYYPQQTDYISDPYNFQSTDELTTQYKLQKQRQLYTNRNNGIKYDAQPLVPPSQVNNNNIPQAQYRGGNNNNNFKSNYNPLSQQSSDSFEGDNSPESYNADENDLNNEFGSLKIQDDDFTKAQMWKKLQQANREAAKDKSGKKNNKNVNRDFQNGGLPPVALKPPSYKKPAQSEAARKNTSEPNYLEKNREAIKNKENLSHRYPDKKYENVHGKNIDQRIKRING
jgi:hypothetical protein